MSSIKTASILGALALVAQVSAHGHVRGITANGVYHVGGIPNWIYGTKPETAGWYAKNQDNGFPDPVYDAPDMICHKGATPGSTSIKVAAGDSIEIHWDTWPSSHKGPVIDYLANANGEFATVDKESLQFVKIAEKGLTSGSWAADELIANNNSWAVNIPSNLAAGNYVLRHEIIALHAAGTSGGAQNYPQCINLEVSGSGSNSLSSGTLGTALYTIDEEGIIFNLYNNPTSYPIPGPALLEGGSGSGSGGSSPAPTTTAGTGAGNGNGNGTAPGSSTTTTTSAAATNAPAPTGNTSILPVQQSTTTAPNSFTSTATGRTGQPTKFVCYAE